MELAGLIAAIIAIIVAVYFGIKSLKSKVPAELQKGIQKIKTQMERVTIYIDGLDKTKDKNKKTLFQKGISLMAGYKYEEAIELFRECLNLESDGSAKSALLLLIGNCFYAWNKWDPALDSWKEALYTAEKANDEQGQAAALGNLGLVYKAKGEWDKAIEFYNKALKGLEKIGDEHGMALTKGNIGILYKQQGRKEEAKRLLEESLRTLEKIGDRPNAEIVKGHLEDL